MRPPARRPTPPRPAEAWAAAVWRAREAWDSLAGGPAVCAECGAEACGHEGERRYSAVAAAAILRVALGLWADSARALADSERPGP